MRLPGPLAPEAAPGFATLLTVIAAHTLLETARDALFLEGLSASALPWAYLTIALLALGVADLSRRAAARLARPRVLAVTLLVGAGGTVVFWWLCALPDPRTLVALYVFGGLLATSVTVQFWLLLSELVPSRQAKRCFSVVAAGGIVGGICGAVLATGIVRFAPARHLLLAAGALFVVASWSALRFSTAPARPQRATVHRLPVGTLTADTYVRALLALGVLASVTTTGIDFVFKLVVERSVPSSELASFFARFYVVVNVLALGVQLGAPKILRVAGTAGALVILPSMAVGASSLAALAVGLFSVSVLKGADGALRHSLHRTSTELLFVPLAASLRDPARGLVAGLGQRGGQALGSLLVLGSLSVRAGPEACALALTALSLAWVASVMRVRSLYVERVRRRAGARASRGLGSGTTTIDTL